MIRIKPIKITKLYIWGHVLLVNSHEHVFQSPPVDFKHGLLKDQNTLTRSHHNLG